MKNIVLFFFFFFQAEDGIRDDLVTGVQTCALPISKCGVTNASARETGPGPSSLATPSAHSSTASPKEVLRDMVVAHFIRTARPSLYPLGDRRSLSTRAWRPRRSYRPGEPYPNDKSVLALGLTAPANGRDYGKCFRGAGDRARVAQDRSSETRLGVLWRPRDPAPAALRNLGSAGGASVHPGGGIPAVLGAMICTSRLLRFLGK